jgi:uncharacterized protein YhbP (UPF0306 family)
MMENKLKNSIRRILDENKLMFLATTNKSKNPESCAVYYCFDEYFNLYFWTDKDSRHSKNILKKGEVAVSIASCSQKWGSFLKGLQIQGKCVEVSKLKIVLPAKLYMKRFPKVKSLIKNPKDFLKKYDSTMFVIKPKWFKILDEKTFGREIWKEAFV